MEKFASNTFENTYFDVTDAVRSYTQCMTMNLAMTANVQIFRVATESPGASEKSLVIKLSAIAEFR